MINKFNLLALFNIFWNLSIFRYYSVKTLYFINKKKIIVDFGDEFELCFEKKRNDIRTNKL